jgi:mRNA interferase MazF
MPEFGDVYVCRFPFTSGTFSKPRPVLVLFDLGADVVICRITSVSYSGPLDIELRSWVAAGLEKPSVARLNRLVTAEKSLLTKYLGRLAAADAAVIKAAWNQHMTL